MRQHCSAALLAFCGLVFSAVADGAPVPRRVYAHHVPWHPPSHARPDRTADAAAGVEGQILSAARAGIDGFAVDLVLKPPSRLLPGLVDMARTAAEKAPGFEIMPCLDLAATKDRAQWEELILGWIEQAGDLPSVGKLGDRYIVFTYAAYGMAAEEWELLRKGIAERGHKLLLVGEINGPMLHSRDKFEPKLPGYADVFDALYCFTPAGKAMHRDIEQALAQADNRQREAAPSEGQPVAERLNVYSVQPGYYRVNTGAFNTQYRGADTYRATWADARRLEPDWVSITTWNDYTENTHVEPSRMLSDIYARITRHEAALSRGATGREPETYWLAAPAEIPDGPGRGPLESQPRRESLFQVMGLAGGDLAEEARLRVTRTDGSEVLSRTLKLERDGPYATAALEWEPAAALKTRVLWVEASVTMAEGRTVSARLPLPVWPRDVAHRYWMPPRWAKLVAEPPPAPRLSIVDGGLRVEPLPAPAGYRTDLLHNLYPELDPASTTAKVADGLDQLPDAPLEWGSREAAVVSPSEEVSWAEPLWVAPEGDPTVLALWRFEDEGAPGADSSIYGRNAGVHAVDGGLARLADGTQALDSGPNVWAQPPGSFCPTQAPVTVELWARPEGTGGGMLWGDVGAAMLLALTEDNRPRVTRHLVEGSRWVVAESREPVPAGEWSHIAGVYSGEQLLLYINGQLAAEAECSGESGTQRMGIGRNPFDGTSIYTGLIDDVRLTAKALPASGFGPLNPRPTRPAEPAPRN